MKTTIAVVLSLLLASGALCAQEQMTVTYENHSGLAGFQQRNPTYVTIFIAQWCSDCQGSKVQQEQIRQAAWKNGWSLLEGDVGTRTEFRDPTNYLRVDPLYQVSYVPTIYAIVNGAITMRIVDTQIYDQNLVKQFITYVSKGAPTIKEDAPKKKKRTRIFTKSE